MAEAKQEIMAYSVSNLNEAVNKTLNALGRVYVIGEISGMKTYPSGHVYFTLKDESASVSCVMFKSNFSRCKIRSRMRDGAQVRVYASCGLYSARGMYQLTVYDMRFEGEGDLMQRYLELKAKLEEEGLFAASRKRPLPFLPRRLALVSSEAGAVIHDMCTVLTRRFPWLEIRLFPSLVQGAEAPPMLIARLKQVYATAQEGTWIPDLLILARGGGSFEDLYCFNDENLVRTLASSPIPTISAIGHETDYTLCDFVADKRAGTPSIAAELAVPVCGDLLRGIQQYDEKLTRLLRQKGESFAQRVDYLGDALGMSLHKAHAAAETRLARLEPRLKPALTMSVQHVCARLDRAKSSLTAYSPYGVLERGYSLTTTLSGAVVRDAASLSAGETIVTRLANGQIQSVVT